ncbi:MAG: hypothetical protein ACHREM_15215 [Polyangiales bacterium]
MRRSSFASLIALLVFGCSSSPTAATSTGDSGSASDTGSSDASIADTVTADAAEGPGFDLDMAITVPSATEEFRCKAFKIPAPATGTEVFMSGYEHHYTAGSHHYLVYRTDLTDIPAGDDTPFDCAEGGGIMQHAGGYAFGGQVPDETVDFPSGVALPLNGGEVVILQVHYIDATSTPIDASIHVRINTMDASQVVHRAGAMRMYDPFVYVPPNTSATAQMRCTTKHDMTVFAAAPHMHARGVMHTTWLDLAGAAPSTSALLTDADWEHPTNYAGTLAVPQGSSFHFRCDYQNPNNQTYYQGQSANTNEMCMLTALFYPDNPDDNGFCFGEGYGGGTTTCSQLLTAIQACPAADAPKVNAENAGVDVGPCWQQALAGSCPNASALMFSFTGCLQSKCASQCATINSTCTSCIATNCAAQYSACNSATCTSP